MTHALVRPVEEAAVKCMLVVLTAGWSTLRSPDSHRKTVTEVFLHVKCSVNSTSHPFTPETTSGCRRRLQPVEPYPALPSDPLMAARNYFCACPKQRVNILMSVTSIDLLLLLCRSGLSSSPLLPRSSSGSLSVSEVAGLLEPPTLQLLKKECGGLQTLLKNNHQVFRGSSEQTWLVKVCFE